MSSTVKKRLPERNPKNVANSRQRIVVLDGPVVELAIINTESQGSTCFFTDTTFDENGEWEVRIMQQAKDSWI
jgi:hypothetical protein